ncbi:muscle M-line assembly protein unc-89-like isoform X2 [Argopecten irradians]|uniref:muscle M-line assembly protein unc-89-like isoform X2 n=1 Tax=Argopecten irradians TaxID=31199 RepID=UPI00371A596C
MSCVITVPVYFGILTIFLIEFVSLQTLNERTVRYTACFGTGDHALINANCSSMENIYPIQLQVGAKPSTSGCPLETEANETDTVVQQCCVPATNQDCIAPYITYAPAIASSYFETCVGRITCFTRQAARVDVLSITSCNATGYPGQTHYMYLDYYCVPGSKIGRFPSVDMTNDGAGSIIHLQGSNYPFMTSVTSMTCSVETDCYEAISIYGLHVDFQLDNVTCNQDLVLNDTSGTLTTIGCANNDATSGYGIRTLATSNDNYIELHYTSVASNQGLIWLAFKVTGNLTVNCPRKDPVNQCLTTTTTPDTTTTTSTTEESTTTTTTEATTSTTTEETTTTTEMTTTTRETTTTTTELTASTTTDTTTTEMMNTTTPETQPTTPASPVQKGASTADTGSSNMIIIIIVVLAGSVVVHSIVLLIISCIQQRKKKRRNQESEKSCVASDNSPNQTEAVRNDNNTSITEYVNEDQPENDSNTVRLKDLPVISRVDVRLEGGRLGIDENGAGANSVDGPAPAKPDADEKTPTAKTDELEVKTENDMFEGKPVPSTLVNENGVYTKPKKKKRSKKKKIPREEDTIQYVTQDTEQQPNAPNPIENGHISPPLAYHNENEDQTKGKKKKKNKKQRKHNEDAIDENEKHGGEPQPNISDYQMPENHNESLKKKKKKKKTKHPSNQIEPENSTAAANVTRYEIDNDYHPITYPVNPQATANEELNEKKKKKRKKKSRSSERSIEPENSEPQRHGQQINQFESLSDGDNAQSTYQESQTNEDGQ